MKILQRILQNQFVLAIVAACTAFAAYGCVYAFRKPFTVATFEGISYAGIGYKVWLVVVQLVGYMCSKFFGIRFIAELKQTARWKVILVLVAIAWLSWLLFALIPAPYNMVFLFTNGFPLGVIWGIVFSYIEGRRTTDFIGAALAVSFIFSSGMVKSVASYLINNWGVSENWMPFVTGLVFVLPLLSFVYLLEQLPPPDAQDLAERHPRLPMNKQARIQLVKSFLPGLVILILVYMFLTIFRDIRDNFAADIWKELGVTHQAAIFTQTEIPVTLIVLLLVASLVLVRSNAKAFALAHVMLLLGFAITGFATWLFVHQQLTPIYWMIGIGVGLYMAYIPFNCMLFERMIATFHLKGNVGFLMYCADAFGYLGSVLVLLVKETMPIKIHWVAFLSHNIFGFAAVGIMATILSWIYFFQKHKAVTFKWNNAQPSLSVPA